MVELMCLLAVLAAFILYFVFLAKLDNEHEKEHKDSLYPH
jgi:hypothetical protein